MKLLLFLDLLMKIRKGEVSEWLKERAWKACVRQKCTGGSNPFLSAKKKQVIRLAFFVSLHSILSWQQRNHFLVFCFEYTCSLTAHCDFCIYKMIYSSFWIWMCTQKFWLTLSTPHFL